MNRPFKIMELLYPVMDVNITQSFGENAAWYADESLHPGWRWPGHNGLDFGGALGDPILAAAGGTVTRAAYEEGGYGHFVRLTHPNGWMTYYAHLSRVDVRLNQRLAAGDCLGAMGDSGCADGVHLHFGLRQSSGALAVGGPSGYAGYIDPLPYFISPFPEREGPGLGQDHTISLTSTAPSTAHSVSENVGRDGSRTAPTSAAPASIPPQGRVRVAVDVLNLRAAPGLDAAIVGVLYAGAAVVYDGVVIQDGCAWLSFGGLYAAGECQGSRYVDIIP